MSSSLAVGMPIPVPPLEAERVPVQLGEKVWTSALEVMVRTMFSSVVVAKV